jgi:hypothetical protein
MVRARIAGAAFALVGVATLIAQTPTTGAERSSKPPKPPRTTTTTVGSTTTDVTTTVAPTTEAPTTTTPASTTTVPATGWPDASNTGVPDGLALHECPLTITASGLYDACHFSGDVDVAASNVTITRSLIDGQVGAGSGFSGQQSGLVIEDTTIDCHCMSSNDSETPPGIFEANYTLRRVNLFDAGHGASVKSNVVIEDSWIHGLGAENGAHKDAIYSGDGTNVLIRHNNIECADGPNGGCTSAVGLLTDFDPTTHYTIDNNLLNTTGSYCFYGSGGPQKPYRASYITFTNNHFGRKYNAQCGFYGPVTYFDSSQPGMVWSGNVWDDTGEPVPPAN